ncbi:class I SAM-dependent methyltransferase [Populibacterium corticicola]|uniref:Class I SAM-dependent methyltransferase n=1 Tax=Populibacterium corticicola TaxID=1812826 RepID=A0ABW5XFC6_9MICO
MDLHHKLAVGSSGSSRDELDGVERLLLAELAEIAGPVERIALVDCGSVLLADELARLFPTAQLVAYDDSYVDASLYDAEVAEREWVDRYMRVAALDSVRFPTELFTGVSVLVLRLPKSLDYLDEFAAAAASGLEPDALVLGAERTKYMTPTQNEVLKRYFGSVTASLGRFKSRALRATEPLGSESLPGAATSAVSSFPRSKHLPELGLTVVAHGGVFAGTKLDIGSRLLVDNLEHLLEQAPHARDFVDAGCGSGVLSARIAQLRESAQVTGVDVSAAAVLSTRETAQANGFADRITAVQDDALRGLPTASADVIVCNPPFHAGTSLDTDVAQRMFREAGRVLRPGGQLWTVYNSPLPYRNAMTRSVGRTVVVGSNRKFTVTVSIKPS